jgi:hypothetical protein
VERLTDGRFGAGIDVLVLLTVIYSSLLTEA